MNYADLIYLIVGLAGQAVQKVTASKKAGQVISLVEEATSLGRAAYDYILAETGQPIDFSKIPQEAPIDPADLRIAAEASATGPSSYADLQKAVEGADPAPAAEPANVSPEVQAASSRCPFCGAAGVATGQTCPACGKVHQ